VSIIAKLKKGKTPRLDGLMAEQILLAHPIIVKDLLAAAVRRRR